MRAGVAASAVAAVAAWRCRVAIRRIEQSVAYAAALVDPSPVRSEGQSRPVQRLAVVVPLLFEQTRLPGLLDHFDHVVEQTAGLLDMELHLVTSEKEGRSDGSTFAMCQRAAAARPYLVHHHCADPRAVMAHQLNVVVDHPDTPEMLAFYNADSRPAPESLVFAADSLGSAEPLGPGVVCQQYGAYVANFRDLEGPGRAILTAAALWQTRWSQSFELPRSLDNLQPGRLRQLRSRRLDLRGAVPRMNYVIGHGLVINRSLLLAQGGFSTRRHNEDACLGLFLAIAGVPVVPSPHLEPSDSPDTVRGLVTQKAVWWGGPALALAYRRDHRRSSFGSHREDDSLWVWWMTAALTNHAACWLLGPTVLAGAIALSPMAPAPAAVCILAISTYVAWPNDVAARRLGAFGLPVPEPRYRFRAAVAAPAMYLLHGVSAWIGLARAAALPFVRELEKPKTPMRVRPDRGSAA